MSTLILICGLPGSGKTTLAKQLEGSRSALRLSPDEWIMPILEDVNNIAERNDYLPIGTFIVTREDLDLWANWFEPPSADEF